MTSKVGTAGLSGGQVRTGGRHKRIQQRASSLGRENGKRVPSRRSCVEQRALLFGEGVTGSGLNGHEPLPCAPVDGRLRVAVDVDEVLGRFLIALNLFCKERYGMEYDVQDYWVYNFAKIWGCSGDMSNHIVHEFFESPHFRNGIPIMPGAQETLMELSTWCDLMVVTSRQHVIEDATTEWICQHFPGVFSSVHFGNHFAYEGVSRKKSAICKEIEADVLIDDNPFYAIDCASNGVDVVLYDWGNAYPWSKMPDGATDTKIQVVSNWVEVKKALQEIKTCQGSVAERL
ncbi:hypothetical protein BSKO_01200 [Bryopsis sp. KO-2023]|nr:hypothetical protein BSKO_01200 [Bryopsis sp. KO-2023]